MKGEKMRLDKFLADCGLGSRSQVKQFIKQKRVTVNQTISKTPTIQIDKDRDQVCLDNELLQHETYVYYLLNKPKGVLSATEDPKHRTVVELLDEKARLKGVFPVGRLDIDTHGLLFLTNNGNLAHALLSPKKHVDKVYRAAVDGILTPEDVAAFAQGIVLKDHICQPALLRILAVDTAQDQCQVEITIGEGKFHQVKRMVRACGKTVTDLQRISMGPLTLGEDLALGQWRRLSEAELASLAPFGADL